MTQISRVTIDMIALLIDVIFQTDPKAITFPWVLRIVLGCLALYRFRKLTRR